VQHFVGYDPEGYSMWFCDYKYTDENTVNYVVMNKVHPATTLSTATVSKRETESSVTLSLLP
jgi:hypothetical protein